MGREFISLHMGQCGVQMGNAIWELLTYEHALNVEGKSVSSDEKSNLEQTGCFFYEVGDKYVPRAIMIDLEPTVIDELRTGAYRQMWNPSALISGKEDAASNYARGYFSVGKRQMNRITEEVQKMVERADSLSGFEIIHSYAGGTGSGLTALVAEHLVDEFGKKFRFTTSIFPSTAYSQSTVDPYNSVLLTRASIDTIDCNILLDNKALYDQCVKNLAEEKPSLSLINRLVASVLSSLFLSHRFIYNGSQHADCTELLTNLIPYPRIHFPLVFYSPLSCRDQIDHEQVTLNQITKAVFTQQSATMDCSIIDKAFLSCAMLYRGVDSPKLVYDALQTVKGPYSRMHNNFVEWCPATFKIGLNTWPPVSVPNDLIAQPPLSVCMIAGNVAVADAFGDNGERFDRMFQKRCFVHWYVSEGMEESEFEQSREEVQMIEDDYNALIDLATEKATFVEEVEENNANSLKKPASKLPPSGVTRQSRFDEKMVLTRDKNQNNRIINNENILTFGKSNSVNIQQDSPKRKNLFNSSVDRKPVPRNMLKKTKDYQNQVHSNPNKSIPRTEIYERIETSMISPEINDWIASSLSSNRLERTNRLNQINVTNDIHSLMINEDSTCAASVYSSLYHREKLGDKKLKERNFNKPDYSSFETNISSTATLPIVVYCHDDQTICNDDFGVEIESSYDGNSYSNFQQQAIQRLPSSLTQPIPSKLDGCFDSDESEFLRMINNTSSLSLPKPGAQSKQRLHSSSRNEFNRYSYLASQREFFRASRCTPNQVPIKNMQPVRVPRCRTAGPVYRNYSTIAQVL